MEKQGNVVYVYNPSFLGGRKQEDHGLKTAQAKSLMKRHLSKQL
jgi:hypothetical protein